MLWYYDIYSNSVLIDVYVMLSTDPCIDGIMNDDETDIDCGGPLCPSCELGEVWVLVS